MISCHEERMKISTLFFSLIVFEVLTITLDSNVATYSLIVSTCNTPGSPLLNFQWWQVLQNKAWVVFHQPPSMPKLEENFGKVSTAENSKVVYGVYLGNIYKGVESIGWWHLSLGLSPFGVKYIMCDPRNIPKKGSEWALKKVGEYFGSGPIGPLGGITQYSSFVLP